ncbi:MAG: carboxypeptidase-like regulatory domain-containing protein [Salegentibacter sp.]
MKKNIYTLILFQFITLFSFSQEIEMNGILTDAETSKPIEFANIGIFGKNKGTVSKLDGKFSIRFPQEYTGDSLTISHVIYETVKIPIKDSKNLVIQLQPNKNILPEVVLSNKKRKNRKIGVKSYNPLLWMGTLSEDTDIIESAKHIGIPDNKTVRVKKVNFYLRRGFVADSAFIRINFYKDVDNFPGEKIVFKNIVQRKKIEQGWTTIDLEENAVFIEEDFFVGVEILPSSKKPFEVNMGAILTKGNAYFRNSSLGTWGKLTGAPSINVEVEF